MAKTYAEVAKECGLTAITACRYVHYMKTRWLETEELKCSTGYAQEWAERFQSGSEMAASDSVGRALLKEMEYMIWVR